MRSKPRFRLVPKHLAATAVVGLTPVWALPLTTLSCVPGFPCDARSDPSCGGTDGGATDGDAAPASPDDGGTGGGGG